MSRNHCPALSRPALFSLPFLSAMAGIVSAGASVPGPPTITGVSPGDGIVHVHLLPPEDTGNAGALFYNTFCYFVDSGAPSGFVGASSTTSVPTTGQTNGSAVRCRATAINEIGVSDASDWSEPVTPGIVPGHPLMLYAAPTNGAAVIHFGVASAEPGTPVLDYEARCSPSLQTVTATASPITIMGLENGVIHDCMVRARNVIGFGAVSATAAVIPTANTTADLGITMSNGTTFVTGGATTRYQVTVTNHGPGDAAGVRVSTALDAALGVPQWTCAPTGIARCAATGQGQVQASVDLGVGSSVTFQVDALVPELPEDPIGSTADVQPPVGIADPSLGNNLVADGPDNRGITRDGFE